MTAYTTHELRCGSAVVDPRGREEPTPCWEVDPQHLDGGGIVHAPTRSAASLIVGEWRSDAAADDELFTEPVTRLLAKPCWVAVCGGCDGGIEDEGDDFDEVHYVSREDAVEGCEVGLCLPCRCTAGRPARPPQQARQ